MNPRETPKANPVNVLTIAKDAHEARIVLPEFQRSFVWGREDIEEFLASIFQNYFVGTFLMLGTSSAKPMFPFRTVEGLELVNGGAQPSNHHQVQLVLDGQQRITSLFYALYAPEVPLRNSSYPHKFFLDLELALQGEIDDAVTGVSTRDRRRMAEMAMRLKQEAAIPFTLLPIPGAFYKWLYSGQKRWGEEDRERIAEVYRVLENFMVPVVGLSGDTGKGNIVNIFERINRTGVSLSLFDLAVARLYLKGIRLRDLWDEFATKNPGVAGIIKPEFIMKVMALFQEKEPRRATLLDIIDSIDAATFATQWTQAAEFIVRAHDRVSKAYGAFNENWIPYTTMLVPLAAILHQLETLGESAEAYQKVDSWYWSNVFAQRYDSAVDTKSLQDLREMRRWVPQGSAPEWITRLRSQSIDLDTDEPRSAVYRGLMCLIVKKGARDFLTGQEANLHRCNDDHIFPRSVYKIRYPVDRISNRSLISEETNKLAKGAKRPSEFLPRFLSGHGGNERALMATLATHYVSAEAFAALKADNFEEFASQRRKTLDEVVEKAIGGTLS